MVRINQDKSMRAAIQTEEIVRDAKVNLTTLAVLEIRQLWRHH